MPYVPKPPELWMTPAEREAHNRIEAAIAERLNRPEPRRPQFSDHAWNVRTATCAMCGISELDFHAVPFGRGLPCGPPLPA